MRTVNFVRTHSKIFHPSLGDLGDVLRPTGTANKTLELKMYTGDHGVYIESKGLTLLIPYGNIQLAVVGPDEAKEALVSVKKTHYHSSAVA